MAPSVSAGSWCSICSTLWRAEGSRGGRSSRSLPGWDPAGARASTQASCGYSDGRWRCARMCRLRATQICAIRYVKQRHSPANTHGHIKNVGINGVLRPVRRCHQLQRVGPVAGVVLVDGGAGSVPKRVASSLHGRPLVVTDVLEKRHMARHVACTQLTKVSGYRLDAGKQENDLVSRAANFDQSVACSEAQAASQRGRGDTAGV